MPLTEEQQAVRKRGVGASEVGAILGVNPWSKPIDVQRSKLGLSEPSPPSPDTERGDFDELALRPWYAHRYRRHVEEVGTLRHEDRPLLIATPDGISCPLEGEGDKYLLEIKSPGQHTQYDWGEDGTDQVPMYHVPQVLWGMAATGLKAAHVVARVRCEMRVYVVPFDQEVFDDIYARVERFWQRHVVKQEPCPPDDSSQYAEHLSRRYSERYPNTLDAPAAANLWAKRLIAAKERRKKAELAVELAKNNLKNIMQGNERMKTEFGICTWKRNCERKVIDYKGLIQEKGISQEEIAKFTQTKPGALVFNDYFTGGEK